MGNGVRGEGWFSREIPGSWFWIYVELKQQQYSCTCFFGQAYAVTEAAASVSGSNSSSNSSSTASAVVVEGVDGRSIGVQYVGTWDFDRNHGKRSIIRIRGRIIVAGEGEAK